MLEYAVEARTSGDSVKSFPFRIQLLFVVSLGVLLCPASSAAQTTNAVVTGRITDPSKAVIVDAHIALINTGTNVRYEGKTNNTGSYVVSALPPGPYRMEVEKPGFKTIVETRIVLHVQDTVEFNYEMALGTSSESITVTADQNNINTTDAAVSTVIDRQFVANLPLNGRSFQELITLSPGVNLIGSAGSTGTSPLGEFTVNGQRATSNYFTVDGVSANIGMTMGNGWGGVGVGGVENAAGGTNAMVSVDALQEFRILTSSFAPEYGRTPGGQIVLLTRSGTNQFHGSVYEYFRNTVLDANDWFANQAGQPRSPLQFNDFGGTFGGPIVKDRTFFFFSYEGQRLNQPQFAVTSVPDAASRAAASPQTQFILNSFPLPNGPELGGGLAQFAAGYSNPINTNATSIRLDHTFNSKLSAFARYSYAPSVSQTRQPGYNLANILASSLTAQTLTSGTTYLITPKLINELRLNLSDNSIKQVYTQNNFGGATPPSGSALFVSPRSPGSATAFLFTNWGGLQQGQWVGLEQRQINLTDGLSLTVGSHQVKFGFDYLRQLPINTGVPYENYNFSDVPSVINNSLSQYTFVYNAPMHEDITEFSLYAQDSWHASSRLTLTYGLRWDLNPPPHSRYPNNQDYIPLLVDSAGNVTLGKAGSSYWNTQYKNFAPRMGAAYTLHQVPGWETVVRAGAGLFYDIGSQAAPNAGWSDFPTFLFSSVSNVSFPVTPQQAALPPVDLSNPAPGSSFTTFPPNFASPRTWEWNISLQQALGSAQTIIASYVAAVGSNLVYGQRFPNVGSQSQDYFLITFDNTGTSNYQALQLQFQRRLSRGLTATAAYTWGHSIDTNSDNLDNHSLPNSVTNATIDRGPSDFDIRHSFSGAISYNLPGYGDKQWLAALSKGWGLDSIFTARSALPVDVLTYHDFAFGRYYLRPDVVPGAPLYLANPNVPGGKVINSAAFVADPNGQGNLGRNALRGFDLVQIDLSLRRSFHLSERFNLLFRADLFNLLNHPNFANPNSIIGRSFFGQSTAMANASVGGSGSFNNAALNSAFQTGGPRTAQLSLKLLF
jgi:hypothetical protein